MILSLFIEKTSKSYIFSLLNKISYCLADNFSFLSVVFVSSFGNICRMMKSIFLFLFLMVGIFTELKAQDDEEYYKPPTKRLDVRNNNYPNLARKSMSLYLGIDGGFKLNYSVLNGALNNLISAKNNNEFLWGASIGYNLDNKWAVETGYMKNPVYYFQSVNSSRIALYREGTALHTIPLRFKYKVLTLDAITKTTAIYVGAGVLLGTNAKEKQISKRKFVSASRQDSLVIRSFITPKARVLFELQTELQGKVANGFYISIFGRMNFAPKGIVYSDIEYFQSGRKIEADTQYLKGISYNFGLLLRFDLARGYKYQSQVE